MDLSNINKKGFKVAFGNLTSEQQGQSVKDSLSNAGSSLSSIMTAGRNGAVNNEDIAQKINDLEKNNSLDDDQKAEIRMFQAFFDKDSDGKISKEEAKKIDHYFKRDSNGVITGFDAEKMMKDFDIQEEDTLKEVINYIQGERNLGINTQDNRIKYDENNNQYYVNAEKWTGAAGENSSLYGIMGNAYPDSNFTTAERKELLDEICKMNGISDPNLIHTDQKINLPVIGRDESGKLQISSTSQNSRTEQTEKAEQNNQTEKADNGIDADYLKSHYRPTKAGGGQGYTFEEYEVDGKTYSVQDGVLRSVTEKDENNKPISGKSYDVNGNLTKETEYENGLMTKTTTYKADGTVDKTTEVQYDKDNNVSSRIQYKDGDINNKVSEFSTETKQSKIGATELSQKVTTEIKYNDDGTKTETVHKYPQHNKNGYIEGTMRGEGDITSTKYNADGKIESETRTVTYQQSGKTYTASYTTDADGNYTDLSISPIDNKNQNRYDIPSKDGRQNGTVIFVSNSNGLYSATINGQEYQLEREEYFNNDKGAWEYKFTLSDSDFQDDLSSKYYNQIDKSINNWVKNYETTYAANGGSGDAMTDIEKNLLPQIESMFDDKTLKPEEKAELYLNILDDLSNITGDASGRASYVKNTLLTGDNLYTVIKNMDDAQLVEFAKEFNDKNLGKSISQIIANGNENSAISKDFAVRIGKLYTDKNLNLNEVLEYFPVTECIQNTLKTGTETDAIKGIISDLNKGLDSHPSTFGIDGDRVDELQNKYGRYIDSAGRVSNQNLKMILDANDLTTNEKMYLMQKLYARCTSLEQTVKNFRTTSGQNKLSASGQEEYLKKWMQLYADYFNSANA